MDTFTGEPLCKKCGLQEKTREHLIFEWECLKQKWVETYGTLTKELSRETYKEDSEVHRSYRLSWGLKYLFIFRITIRPYGWCGKGIDRMTEEDLTATVLSTFARRFEFNYILFFLSDPHFGNNR